MADAGVPASTAVLTEQASHCRSAAGPLRSAGVRQRCPERAIDQPQVGPLFLGKKLTHAQHRRPSAATGPRQGGGPGGGAPWVLRISICGALCTKQKISGLSDLGLCVCVCVCVLCVCVLWVDLG